MKRCILLTALLGWLSLTPQTLLAQFECGAPVSYQGYSYSTVQIGDQCWFAENLRNENYENGDAIPAGLSTSEWDNASSGASAAYDLEVYGRLYNWYAVDDGRGLCPSGWHVPSDGEWTVLTDHLGGESVAGGQMKSTYGWGDDGNGTNSSGFTGLPGGYRGNSFSSAGGWGSWWSSTPTTPDGWLQGSGGWSRNMSNSWDVVDNQILAGEGQGVASFETAPGSGLSVRCIEDAE